MLEATEVTGVADVVSVSSANSWSTLHTGGLPRKRDAKTFRGDVSEKIRCTASPHPSKLLRGDWNTAIMTFR
jgi:hypothetical protein